MNKFLLLPILFSLSSFASNEMKNYDDIFKNNKEEKVFIRELNNSKPENIYQLLDERFKGDSEKIQKFIRVNELYNSLDKADDSAE